MGLNSIRIKIADFLSTPLLGENIDSWLIIHFLSGILLFIFLGYFIKKSQYRKKLIVFLSMLAAWEIFELIVIGTGSSLFARESAVNIFYDIGIGFFGGFIVLKYFQK